MDQDAECPWRSDHIDVIGVMAQGGQMRFNVSAVLGHAPDLADVHIFGTEGTIRLRQPVGGALALSAGKRFLFHCRSTVDFPRRHHSLALEIRIQVRLVEVNFLPSGLEMTDQAFAC